MAEWSRALVLGSSHFNNVGSSFTVAKVQWVSAGYLTFFQFPLRWSAHFAPKFYIFMSTEDICSGLNFFKHPLSHKRRSKLNPKDQAFALLHITQRSTDRNHLLLLSLLLICTFHSGCPSQFFPQQQVLNIKSAHTVSRPALVAQLVSASYL